MNFYPVRFCLLGSYLGTYIGTYIQAWMPMYLRLVIEVGIIEQVYLEHLSTLIKGTVLYRTFCLGNV